MPTLDASAIGMVIAALMAVVSFALGRSLSKRWQERRRTRDEASKRAAETRQARRARERAERKR